MNNRTVRIVGAVLGLIVGVIYLINPTAGILELLPDNVPLVGNLDEAGATALVIWAIQQLRRRGDEPLELPPARGRREVR
jgi:hypothetical protein